MTIAPSQRNRLGSAIQAAVALAALLESEAEWEAAEQTRIVLYYLLIGDASGACQALRSRALERVEFSLANAVGPHSEIADRLAEVAMLVSAMNCSEQDEPAGISD